MIVGTAANWSVPSVSSNPATESDGEGSVLRRVFCLGNFLHGDDGVGSHIAEILRQCRWPENIEIVDLGIRVLELPGLLEGCVEVVVVDASHGNEPVGRVAVHRADEILQREAGGTISHAADLRFALRLAQAELGVLPPTHVVTVAVPALRVF